MAGAAHRAVGGSRRTAVLLHDRAALPVTQSTGSGGGVEEVLVVRRDARAAEPVDGTAGRARRIRARVGEDGGATAGPPRGTGDGPERTTVRPDAGVPQRRMALHERVVLGDVGRRCVATPRRHEQEVELASRREPFGNEGPVVRHAVHDGSGRQVRGVVVNDRGDGFRPIEPCARQFAHGQQESLVTFVDRVVGQRHDDPARRGAGTQRQHAGGRGKVVLPGRARRGRVAHGHVPRRRPVERHFERRHGAGALHQRSSRSPKRQRRQFTAVRNGPGRHGSRRREGRVVRLPKAQPEHFVRLYDAVREDRHGDRFRPFASGEVQPPARGLVVRPCDGGAVARAVGDAHVVARRAVQRHGERHRPVRFGRPRIGDAHRGQDKAVHHPEHRREPVERQQLRRPRGLVGVHALAGDGRPADRHPGARIRRDRVGSPAQHPGIEFVAVLSGEHACAGAAERTGTVVVGAGRVDRRQVVPGAGQQRCAVGNDPGAADPVDRDGAYAGRRRQPRVGEGVRAGHLAERPEPRRVRRKRRVSPACLILHELVVAGHLRRLRIARARGHEQQPELAAGRREAGRDQRPSGGHADGRHLRRRRQALGVQDHPCRRGRRLVAAYGRHRRHRKRLVRLHHGVHQHRHLDNARSRARGDRQRTTGARVVASCARRAVRRAVGDHQFRSRSFGEGDGKPDRAGGLESRGILDS